MATATVTSLSEIEASLGADAGSLLQHRCETVPRESLHLPGPDFVKINHNEFLTYPNKYDQILFGTVREAWEMGAAAVGATVYFGSEESSRQLVEIARAFHEAHELGMATVLWCYLRNSAFTRDGVNYEVSA